MANIEITFTNSAGATTFTSPEYTDVKFDRLIDYAWAAYPQVDENGDPLPDTNANLAEALKAMAAGTIQGYKANVVNHENVALKAAANADDMEPDA